MARRTHAAHTSACEAFEEDLVLLHYGDLRGAERQKLDSHLAGCAGCAAYLKELATLLPLTVKSDEPPQEFWQNYSRELRGKLDDVAAKQTWWRNLAAIFRPNYIPAFATAAVVVIALTFTLSKTVWNTKSNPQDDEMAETLPVAENLDFFSAMDILDDLELLELIGSQSNNAA